MVKKMIFKNAAEEKTLTNLQKKYLDKDIENYKEDIIEKELKKQKTDPAEHFLKKQIENQKKDYKFQSDLSNRKVNIENNLNNNGLIKTKENHDKYLAKQKQIEDLRNEILKQVDFDNSFAEINLKIEDIFTKFDSNQKDIYNNIYYLYEIYKKNKTAEFEKKSRNTKQIHTLSFKIL